MGAVAKSYMRKGFLIHVHEEMQKYLAIYEETFSHNWVCNRSPQNFLIYEEKLIFFFINAAFLMFLNHGHFGERKHADNEWRFSIHGYPIVEFNANELMGISSVSTAVN